MKCLVAIIFVAFLLTISSTQLLWVFFYYSNKKSGTFSEAKICLKFIHHENDQRKLSNATQQLARRAEVVLENVWFVWKGILFQTWKCFAKQKGLNLFSKGF